MTRHPADIDESFVPAPRAGVSDAVLDGEGVLYDDEHRAVHVVNPTALAVWSCYDGRASLARIADDLSTAYGAPRDVVLDDVVRVTREFGELSLLDGVEGETTAPTATPPRYLEPPHG